MPKVQNGDWTHVVATFKNNQQSQICMTSGKATKGVTLCNTYTPTNVGSKGKGLLRHFNLGGCQTWNKHTVNADIAVINIYNRLLTKNDIEARYNVMKRRGTAAPTNEFGPTAIGFSTALGSTGSMEGCFGTVDAEEEIPFSINSETGQISTSKLLNFEHNQQWGLQIRVSDNGGLQQTMNANNVLSSSISNPKETNRIVLVNVVDINEQPTFTTSCSSEKSREVLREYDISLNSAYDSSKFLQMQHSVQGVRSSAASFVQMLPLNPSLRSTSTKERMTFKMTKGLYDPRGYSLSWGEGTRHGT